VRRDCHPVVYKDKVLDCTRVGLLKSTARMKQETDLLTLSVGHQEEFVYSVTSRLVKLGKQFAYW
jgi:hypothetical protein